MKRYNKPSTEIHNIELQSMIADSVKINTTATPITNSTTGWTDLSKENDMTSPSVWGDDEEE